MIAQSLTHYLETRQQSNVVKSMLFIKFKKIFKYLLIKTSSDASPWRVTRLICFSFAPRKWYNPEWCVSTSAVSHMNRFRAFAFLDMQLCQVRRIFAMSAYSLGKCIIKWQFTTKQDLMNGGVSVLFNLFKNWIPSHIKLFSTIRILLSGCRAP